LKRAWPFKRPGSIGKALMHVEARVVDDDMKDVPPAKVGELVIRGPTC
jgi:fatty-acyl-CoA synthase